MLPNHVLDDPDLRIELLVERINGIPEELDRFRPGVSEHREVSRVVAEARVHLLPLRARREHARVHKLAQNCAKRLACLALLARLLDLRASRLLLVLTLAHAAVLLKCEQDVKGRQFAQFLVRAPFVRVDQQVRHFVTTLMSSSLKSATTLLTPASDSDTISRYIRSADSS